MAIGFLRPYTSGREFESCRTNVEKQDSVVRRLEIIGEAVKGIPSAARVVTVPAIAPTNGTGRTA